MTTLAVGPAQTRGFALTAFASFDFADVIVATTGVGVEVFRLPLGATAMGGYLSVGTVFNSGTSDSLELGDATDDNRYLAATDAQAAADSELLGNLLGYKVVAADRPVLLEWTAVGAVPTTGAGSILMLYADPEYNTINYES